MKMIQPPRWQLLSTHSGLRVVLMSPRCSWWHITRTTIAARLRSSRHSQVNPVFRRRRSWIRSGKPPLMRGNAIINNSSRKLNRLIIAMLLALAQGQEELKNQWATYSTRKITRPQILCRKPQMASFLKNENLYRKNLLVEKPHKEPWARLAVTPLEQSQPASTSQSQPSSAQIWTKRITSTLLT